MNLHEIYTVEYSTTQRCYHIDTLDRTLANNLIAVARNINNGYLLIGLFLSHEAAADFVKYHRSGGAVDGMEVVLKAINDNQAF